MFKLNLNAMRKLFLLFDLSLTFTIMTLIIVTSCNLYASNNLNDYYKDKFTSEILIEQKLLCTPGTWDGSTNDNWNESTNWCDNIVPTYTTNVTIPSGVTQPVIYQSAECNKITINSGATLTIAGSNTLIVYGDWFNAGTFIANSGTVIYNGNNQYITGPSVSNYNNVIISGNGGKTIYNSYFITNGTLTMEGTSLSTLSQVPKFGPNATLRYNSAFAKNTGNEWPDHFTAQGGIIIDGTGIITISQIKTLEESVPLLINPGATLVINNKNINFKGNFLNKGTFNITTASVTIDGSQAQSIDGFTTTGNLIINKTAGTATLTSDVTAGELQTTNSGILHLGEGLTHTFTGTWKKGNSTLNGGSSTLRLAGGYMGTSGVFNANSGTVEWFSANNQDICGLSYNHLVISGAGIKTLTSSISIIGDITIHAGATLDLKQTTIKSNSTGKSVIVNGLLKVGGNFPSDFTNFYNEGGSIEYNSINSLQYIKNLNYYNLIISGDYSKTFTGNTLVANKISIRDGVKCTLAGYLCTSNSLTLGDYTQVSGTWGGVGSGATHVNNCYFNNSTGKLTVNQSIITPGLWIGLTDDWSAATNWSDGIIPTSATDAILSATGLNPKIYSSAACRNLTILPYTTLTIDNSNNLMVSKDWINNGTFTSNKGSVNFIGGDQSINKGSFYNLTLSGSGVKTISSEVTVNNILSMEGTANVSNYVFLASAATLQYNTSIDRTTGAEWPGAANIFSNIIFNNTGVITISGNKTIHTIPITIKEGATLNVNNFELISSGGLNLECGGLSGGSLITGTGTVAFNGNITVTNAGHGIAPAKIFSKINMPGPYTFNIANGNTDQSSDTDLLVNTIDGGSYYIIKSGEGTLYINNSGKFSNLTISEGNVIVPVYAEVSVSNTTTINCTDGLVVESDENGSGSLITNSVSGSGNAIVKCYMTSNAWHLVAPPIASENIQRFLLANESIPANQYQERALRDYNPVLNEWNDFFSATTIGNMAFGKGYVTRVRASKTHEIVFSGMLNAGNITVGNLSAGNWNCIGNPYTSAIAINVSATGLNTANFLTVNASNIDPAYGIYIWDRTDAYNGQSNQYTAISNVPVPGASFPVQIGQGFMVKMAATKTGVSFTKAMQLHNTALRLKSTDDVWPLIELVASADSLNSSTILAFHDGMTNGLDPTYDAGLLRADAPLQISTRLVDDYGIPFAIQALPAYATESVIVPIDIEYTLGGEVSFSAIGSYLPIDCKLILEDRQNHTFTNLINQNYIVHLPANSVSTERFYLHTSYSTTGMDTPNSEHFIKAWQISDDQLYILGYVSQGAKASLYDLQGRRLASCLLYEGRGHTMEIPAVKAGVYVLQVDDQGGRQVLKMGVRGR